MGEPPTNRVSAEEVEITLGLLNAVHTNEHLTQRSIAQDLGIALGLANAYVRRCVKKGLIKVRQVPRRRYAYYLTPRGFAEKTRLTAEYLSSSLGYFRRARAQFGEVFQYASGREWRRIALVGPGELAEIAVLSAREFKLELVGIVAPAQETSVLGLPVFASFQDVPPVDALVITDIADPQGSFNAACERHPRERVLAPRFIGVVRTPVVNR